MFDFLKDNDYQAYPMEHVRQACPRATANFKDDIPIFYQFLRFSHTSYNYITCFWLVMFSFLEK